MRLSVSLLLIAGLAGAAGAAEPETEAATQKRMEQACGPRAGLTVAELSALPTGERSTVLKCLLNEAARAMNKDLPQPIDDQGTGTIEPVLIDGLHTTYRYTVNLDAATISQEKRANMKADVQSGGCGDAGMKAFVAMGARYTWVWVDKNKATIAKHTLSSC